MADPTRERILREALVAFAERGFEGASTREIARAAEANQGLVTYYFRDKARLWQRAVEHGLSALGEGLAVLDPGAPGRERGLVVLLEALALHAPVLRAVARECLAEGPRLRWLARGPLAGVVPRVRLGLRGVLGAELAGTLALTDLVLLLGAAAALAVASPGARALAGVDPEAPGTRRACSLVLANALAGTLEPAGDWSLGAARRRRWTHARES